MKRIMAVRSTMSGVPASLYTSELAFAAAQQSQAGLLATLALRDLVMLVLVPLMTRLWTGRRTPNGGGVF